MRKVPARRLAMPVFTLHGARILMGKTDRIVIYIVGFVFGSLVVSMLMKLRAYKEETRIDPWVTHNIAAVEAGAEPLPE